MFKFFATAAALVASAAAQQCVVVDFTTQAADFVALNNVVTIANTGLIALYVPNPLTIAATTYNATPFEVFGLDFTVTPTINSLEVTGLADLQIGTITATGAHSLSLSATIPEATVNASITVSLAQPNGPTDPYCFTDISNPSTCAPLTITGDATFGLTDVSVSAGLDAYISACAVGASGCTNLTVTSILTAAITGDLTNVLTSIEEKFINTTLTSLDFSFGSVSTFDLALEDTTTLLNNQFANKVISEVLTYTASDINTKGDAYKEILALANVGGLWGINKIIDEQLEPLFGATCV